MVNDEPTTVEQLRGCAPDFTGDLTTDEWIDRQREADAADELRVLARHARHLNRMVTDYMLGDADGAVVARAQLQLERTLHRLGVPA